MAAVFVPAAGAGPAAPATIEALLGAADAIVIATIVEATVTGDVTSVSLSVETPIRGSIERGALVSVVWSNLPLRNYIPSSVQKSSALFFLRQNAPGQWSVVPATLGAIGFERTFFLLPEGDRPAEFEDGSESAIADRVFLVLAWAKSAAQRPDVGARFDLVESFRNLRSPITSRTFQRFSDSSSPALAVMGLRGLVLHGDVRVLSRIERNAGLLDMPAANGVVDHIKYYYSNPDPAGVRVLGRLASAESTKQQLKLAAACALARLHTVEALPYLARFLEDPDITMKTYGVGGLSMFANNITTGSHHPAPGEWRYRSEETMAHSAMSEGIIAQSEARYVGFWRDWWNQHQVELAPQ